MPFHGAADVADEGHAARLLQRPPPEPLHEVTAALEVSSQHLPAGDQATVAVQAVAPRSARLQARPQAVHEPLGVISPRGSCGRRACGGGAHARSTWPGPWPRRRTGDAGGGRAALGQQPRGQGLRLDTIGITRLPTQLPSGAPSPGTSSVARSSGVMASSCRCQKRSKTSS